MVGFGGEEEAEELSQEGLVPTPGRSDRGGSRNFLRTTQDVQSATRSPNSQHIAVDG